VRPRIGALSFGVAVCFLAVATTAAAQANGHLQLHFMNVGQDLSGVSDGGYRNIDSTCTPDGRALAVATPVSAVCPAMRGADLTRCN
jgi:hypothetical protein